MESAGEDPRAQPASARIGAEAMPAMVRNVLLISFTFSIAALGVLGFIHKLQSAGLNGRQPEARRETPSGKAAPNPPLNPPIDNG